MSIAVARANKFWLSIRPTELNNIYLTVGVCKGMDYIHSDAMYGDENLMDQGFAGISLGNNFSSPYASIIEDNTSIFPSENLFDFKVYRVTKKPTDVVYPPDPNKKWKFTDISRKNINVFNMVNFHYDSDKYKYQKTTISLSQDDPTPVNIAQYFANKKLYKICNGYIDKFTANDTSGNLTFIFYYLEKK